MHGNADAKLLVTRYLPGELVFGSKHADDPSTYRRAGELPATITAELIEHIGNEILIPYVSGASGPPGSG